MFIISISVMNTIKRSLEMESAHADPETLVAVSSIVRRYRLSVDIVLNPNDDFSFGASFANIPERFRNLT